MLCPVCKNTKLMMSDKQGVEIDYCPDCRGVWLDRGELDKIIERSTPAVSAPPPPPQQERYQEPRREYHDTRQQDYRKDRYYKKKRPENLLKELFDF